MDTASILKLVTSPLLSPRCAGTEVELVLTGAPAAGTDSDEIDDLAAMTGSWQLLNMNDVVPGGIELLKPLQ